MVKKVGKYEIGRTLGEGTFGKVKHAINVETNEAVAIKILDKEKIQKQNMGNQIKREISIMKMVKHRYIVEMYEVLASKTKIFIVLEVVSGGELFDKIVRDGKFSEELALFYFNQLVEGVEYCHKVGVCHRDLKPENLLLDEHGNLKISDFGLSSLYVGDAESDGASRTEVLHTTCGTPNYVAPEVLADKGYDGKKADVWSIGVILYVLLAGFLPFDESTIMKLFEKIQKGEFTFPSWFSPDARRVINSMLVVDPHTRVSLAQLRQDPWVKKYQPAEAEAAQVHDSSTKKTEAVAAAVADASSNAMYEDEDLPDIEVDEHNEAGVVHELRKLNAFELVSKCGGFYLDRLYIPDMYFGSQSFESRGDMENVKANGENSYTNGQFQEKISRFKTGARKRSGKYDFTSPVVPAKELVKSLYEALIAMGCEIPVNIEHAILSGAMSVTKLTPKGMIGWKVYVYELTDALSFVEIHRGKGDLLEWNNMYNELITSRINHLITCRV